MEDKPIDPEPLEDSSIDPILIEFMSGLPEGLHLELLQAYVDSPTQEAIENYLEVCRRTLPDGKNEQ